MKEKIEVIFGSIAVIIVAIYNIPVLFIAGCIAFIVWLLNLPFKKNKKRLYQKKALEFANNENKVGYLEYDRNYFMSDSLETNFIPKYSPWLLIDLVDGDKYKISDQHKSAVSRMREYAEIIKDDTTIEDGCTADSYPAILYTIHIDGTIEMQRVPIRENGKNNVDVSLNMLEKTMQNILEEWNIKI